jgi:hypothetical protein
MANQNSANALPPKWRKGNTEESGNAMANNIIRRHTMEKQLSAMAQDLQ